MCLFFGDFAIWSFLVYILFKVSMSSHKWSRVCSSALTINWISLSLILFSVWSILILFLSCWLFFYSTASRILNPPMQNHLYTPSFLFAIFFFFFSPSETGQAVWCAGYQYSAPQVHWNIWLHLVSFLECIFLPLALSHNRNLDRLCHISAALCS